MARRVVELYLVRHAIAEQRDSRRWPDDALRPLSADGRELFRAAARGLCRLGVGVDCVLTSTNARAAETAAILTEEAGWPEAVPSRALEPFEPVASALEALAARTERALAIVGHQPELSELASLVLTGNTQALAVELKKGSVTCVRFAGRVAPGAGILRFSLTPKVLRELDR